MEWLKTWLEGSVAAYAAIVATAALALEIRRWLESGVRIALSTMPGAILVGGALNQGQKRDRYLGLTASNRGDVATTITHMVLFNYGSWRNRLTRNPIISAIVPEPTAHSGQPFPCFLEPGRYFHGLALYSPELESWIETGWLYVGVICTHDVDPILVRVKKTPIVSRTHWRYG